MNETKGVTRMFFGPLVGGGGEVSGGWVGGGGVCLCSVDRDCSSWVVLYKNRMTDIGRKTMILSVKIRSHIAERVHLIAHVQKYAC